MRFYIKSERLNHDTIKIEGPQAHHLINVLRIKPARQITLFDGNGYEYQAIIKEIHTGKVTVIIKNKTKPPVESHLNIVLGQALIKADKLELVIQKATELGVSQIIPVKTTRSRRTEESILFKRQRRWQNIILEATRQSGRTNLLQIGKPTKLTAFCSAFNSSYLKLFFYEKQPMQTESTTRKLNDIVLSKPNIALLIGPEGGFSEAEALIAKQNNFTALSLGPRILRSETAAISALSIIQYQFGDL